MRRLLAVVAAAAMVAGSVYLRWRLDREKEAAAGPVRIVCAMEFEQACRQLEGDGFEITVEPTVTTADRLAATTGDAAIDAWFVTGPWPVIVDGRRRTRTLPPVFGNDREPIARTPIVLVVWKERAAALVGRCGGQVTWKCLGDAAAAGPWTASGGRPEWGAIKPGYASPATDDLGLLVLGSAVSNWFGHEDLSTTDLDTDEFARWFTALNRAVPPAATSPLQLMLTAGPAVYDAVGTVEAEAGPLLAASARRNDLQLLYPSPVATADAVLAIAKGSPAIGSLRRAAQDDGMKRALATDGWRVADVGTAQGVSNDPPLPRGNGLPSPGLLDALLARWREVTGR